MSRHPGPSLQQDNARPYTAYLFLNCLRAVKTLAWPTRSSDLSPIKHVWDTVGCQIRGPQNIADLRKTAATRGLLATDHIILNHGQVTWTTPELAPPLLTTTPHQREDVSALDRFNVHRCPTRRVFNGTGLDPVTKQATVRYLYHSATAATLNFSE
ncbi:uncharacterized protein TNCV_141651 [Trichonephila clavipes]|nr:uncharacterized protein TNCV_141651 [Trichonephila clavipes]